MKSAFRLFLFAAVLVAIAHSYPGAPRDSSDSSEDLQQNTGVDTVLVLPGIKNPFSGPIFANVDTDDDSQSPGYYGLFNVNPFEGFLTGIMKRLREQMSSVLSRIPETSFISPWGEIPDGAKTTFTTKIVDGHVITINETTYSRGNDSNGAIFRLRVIDVKPQNDTLETVGGGELETELITESSESETANGVPDNSTPARSVETVEDDSKNEIPKSQVEMLNA